MTAALLALWVCGIAPGCAPQEPASLDLAFERQTRPVAPGLEYAHLSSAGANGNAPLSAHLLAVDLGRIEARIALAADQVLGRETTSAMVERRGAAAGINGGFFIINDASSAELGDPNGFFALDGSVVSDPVAPRASLGICDDGAKPQRPVIVRPRVVTTLRPAAAEPFGISGRNRARDADDLLLYTPVWGPTTGAAPGGLEVAVQSGGVIARSEAGSTPIPPGGYVLSASGSSADRFAALEVGSEIDLQIDVTSLDDPESDVPLDGCSYASAGPRIVGNGEAIVEYSVERFRDSFTLQRHPRTAVGWTADGQTLLVVVVDGRQPELSVGMTLPELARLLVAEGAEHAYNLDGGGSSTMVVEGSVVNSPSDGAERPNSDGVLFFIR